MANTADDQAGQPPAQAKQPLVVIPHFFYYYNDGSAERRPPGPLPAPSPHPAAGAVASKDITLDANLGLWARLFLPPVPPPQKIPLVLYFHGGVFVYGSPAWNHAFCENMAARSSALWVSFSYRLGPEHHLPAAFEDGLSALRWVQAQASLQSEGKEELMDDWLKRADFSKCFLSGESAGGSIANHLALHGMNKRPPSAPVWEPAMNVRGLILIHPGFAREKKSKEEMASGLDWDLVARVLALLGPLNPFDYIDPLKEFAVMDGKFVLPKTLIALADMDGLHFMGLDYVQALQNAGCSVEMVMSHGVDHLFFHAQPESEQAITLFNRFSDFIKESSD